MGRTANVDAHLLDQGGVLGQGIIFPCFLPHGICLSGSKRRQVVVHIAPPDTLQEEVSQQHLPFHMQHHHDRGESLTDDKHTSQNEGEWWHKVLHKPSGCAGRTTDANAHLPDQGECWVRHYFLVLSPS